MLLSSRTKEDTFSREGKTDSGAGSQALYSHTHSGRVCQVEDSSGGSGGGGGGVGGRGSVVVVEEGGGGGVERGKRQ